MTDERIKESLENWKPNILTVKEEESFADFVGWGRNNRSVVIGFYAGFRAAERLAKIEALEGVKKILRPVVDSDTETDYRTGYQQAGETIEGYIDDMIAELKEEGE